VRFAEAVERTIRRHAMLASGDAVLVAVSGGADSVALVHTLVTLAPAWRLRLHVLHVDHGLRPDSVRDAAFVRTLGARLGVPVEVAVVAVGPGSLEDAARVARYAALEAGARRVGATRIALGHTADDQAETVLMRLLSGSGVRGLAGIPPVRGAIIRPLIERRRAEVLAALASAGLPWVEDPTNRDPKFLRNRVRHELLPLLVDAWEPDMIARLNRVARDAREAVDALDREASAALERLASAEGEAVTLSRTALAALSRPVAAEVLRQAAARLGSRAPLRGWGHRGLRRVLATPAPRRPFRLGGVLVEVSGDRVRVATSAPPPLGERTLAVPGRVELPEIGAALEARLVPMKGYVVPRDARTVAFDAAALPRALAVRPRRRGDRFRAFGDGERRLKSFLIDTRIPRWERSRLPVVEAGGEIVWLAGLRRAAMAPVTPATREVVELRLVALAEQGGPRVECGPGPDMEGDQ
jgi:tRNA(Ile)-lysidine synthase